MPSRSTADDIYARNAASGKLVSFMAIDDANAVVDNVINPTAQAQIPSETFFINVLFRSEERRVGKEC